MNEPPGARLRAGLSGLTMAEYFRDQGQDTLLFIDNIFRFVQAGSRCRRRSADAERRRLPADARDRDGSVAVKITSTRTGSVTSVQAIYVPADDYRPGAGEYLRPPRRHDRAVARDRREGDLPGRRPARLDLRALQPGIVSDEHYSVATRWQVLQRYSDLQDIIAILGMDELTDEDKLVVRAPARSSASLSRTSSPSSSRAPRASTSSSRTRSRASARSSRASTTTCPRPRSTWSGRSRARSRRPRRPQRRRSVGRDAPALRRRARHPGGRGLPARRRC